MKLANHHSALLRPNQTGLKLANAFGVIKAKSDLAEMANTFGICSQTRMNLRRERANMPEL